MDVRPDLLTLQDGCAVTASNWRQRRAELSDVIIPSAYGGMPSTGRVELTLMRLLEFAPHPIPINGWRRW